MSIFLGSTKTIDKVAVNEVIQFAENDSRLYDVLMNVYLPNLKKKKKSGKYNSELAVKLLEYYYTNYVRPEMIKPSKYGWDSKLNPAERKLFGKYFVEVLETEYL
jgi:hypothetical protein